MNDTSNKNHGINVGTSLILVAFVLICLVAFAALSFASANSDHRLSTLTLERKTDYINACNKAEEKLARIDEILHSCYDKARATGDNFSEEYFRLILTELASDSDISFIEASNSSSDNISTDSNSDKKMLRMNCLSFTIKQNDKEHIKVELELTDPNKLSFPTEAELFNIITYKTELINNDNINIDDPEIGYLF